MKILILLLATLALTSCSKFGFMGVETVERAATEIQSKRTLASQLLPVKLEVVPVVEDTSIAAQACEGFIVNARAQNGLLSGVNADLLFTLSSDNSGKFYEDAACSREASKQVIAKGFYSRKFYFKSGPIRSGTGSDLLKIVANTTYFQTTGVSNVGSFSAKTLSVINLPPEIADADFVVNEDGTLSGQLSATDENGDSVTFVKYSDPGHASLGSLSTLLSASGKITYVPQANFNGPDSFQYYVFDGRSASAVKTVRLAVNPINDAPVLVGLSASTNEDTARAINLSQFVNDVDTDPLLNLAYSEELTYQVVTGPSKATFDLILNTLSYSPNLNLNGPDSLVIRVKDKGGLEATGTLAITINPVNDAPVALNRNISLVEDTPLNESFSATDVDSANLVYSVFSAPSKGSVTILDATTGAYRYTPNLNANGSDSFTYRVHDGALYSNTAAVTVSISPVNDAPDANDALLLVTEDINKSGFLTATDVDSSGLTYTLLSNGTKGVVTLTNSSTGAFVYDPNPEAVGTDSFTFRASDGLLNSDVGTISININSVNDSPVAQDGTLTISEDTIGNGTLNATDADSANLNYSIRTAPRNGTVAILNSNTGTYRYTPNFNYSGSDNFIFEVSDGNSTDSANIQITINAVNDAPVGQNDSHEFLMNTSKVFALRANDVDSSYSFSLGSASAGSASLSGSNVTYNPPNGFVGTATLNFTVTDSGGLSDAGTITLIVGDGKLKTVANGPLCTGGDTVVISGTVLKTRVSGIPSVDKDIFYTLTLLPLRGNLMLNGSIVILGGKFTQLDIESGRIRYVPTLSGGTDVLEYTVDYLSDGTDILDPNPFEIRQSGGDCQ